MNRRSILIVLVALGAGQATLVRAQEVRLGTETRSRKLSLDTVADRRIVLGDGKAYTYRRDKTFVFEDRRGRRYPGKWDISFGNVIDMAYDDGDTEQIYYVTIDGKLYFKRTDWAGGAGQNAERHRVVRIEPVR